MSEEMLSGLIGMRVLMAERKEEENDGSQTQTNHQTLRKFMTAFHVLDVTVE